MFPNTLDSIDDAYAIVRHYNLHQADFGGGTAEGLAAFMYVPGQRIWSVWHLAGCLAEYKAAFANDASRGKDLDARLLSEAAELTAFLRAHMDKRRQLAEFVRSVKFGPQGGAVWAAIAELATTPFPAHSTVYRATRAPLERMAAVLGEMQRHTGLLHGAPNGYEPGTDAILDLMVRLDVERLDIAFEAAKPWAGREEEMAYELEALFRLCGEQGIAALEGAMKASAIVPPASTRLPRQRSSKPS